MYECIVFYLHTVKATCNSGLNAEPAVLKNHAFLGRELKLVGRL